MSGKSFNAFDVLAFHQEAGVDIALDVAPVDCFRESVPDAEPLTTPDAAISVARQTRAPLSDFKLQPQASVTSVAPIASDDAAMAAREMAKQAKSLDELREILARFDGCALKKTAKSLVFADGNPRAKVMFVGEAPGAEEDRDGLPFVGRSGKLLDRMMASIGLDRDSVYIANIVPWRPPGNRTPTPQESAICLPFIQRQIELADPDILVCLGGPSVQTLLRVTDGITKVRGRWFDYDTGTRKIRALATFHPAYLLRNPLAKRHSWRDFIALKKALTGLKT
jgi:uracil-DNA glycosylase